MAYPVRAYRRKQRRGDDAEPIRRRGSQDDRPATNLPPRGRPANENNPRGLPWADYPDVSYSEPEAKGLPRIRTMRIAGIRRAANFVPHFRVASQIYGLIEDMVAVGRHPSHRPQVAGWTYRYDCAWVPGGDYPINRMVHGIGSLPFSCVSGQALGGSAVYPGTIPAGRTYFRTFELNAPLVNRWRSRHAYDRPAGGPATFATPVWPSVTQVPSLNPYPTVDPHAMPIGQPQLTPRALPRRFVNGRRADPSQFPGRRWEATYGRIRFDPEQDTLTTVRFNPKPRVSVRPRPLPKPPGPRTRELKSFVARFAGYSRKILDGLGEIEDFVDSILEGVKAADPKWLAAKRREWKTGPMWKVWGIGDETLTYKTWLLYQAMRADIVDVPAALKGLADNELEDRAYGAQGQQLKGANKAANNPAGWGLGPAL